MLVTARLDMSFPFFLRQDGVISLTFTAVNRGTILKESSGYDFR